MDWQRFMRAVPSQEINKQIQWHTTPYFEIKTFLNMYYNMVYDLLTCITKSTANMANILWSSLALVIHIVREMNLHFEAENL